ERVEALAPQGLGDVLGNDALGETLDDGGLADAGLTDEHGVVLGAAREDLHDPLDLPVAADDRVELALAGGLGPVPAELVEDSRNTRNVPAARRRGAAGTRWGLP